MTMWKVLNSNVEWQNVGEVVQEIDKQEVEKQIAEINLWREKYENWELNSKQTEQYKSLMDSIKKELDKEVPTVIQMNENIDNIKYLQDHPEKAAQEANNIVKDYRNKDNVDLVGNIMEKQKYLPPEHQWKLYSIISQLNEEVKNTLDNLKKERAD